MHAVKALSEAGIESRTGASLLVSSLPEHTAKGLSILVGRNLEKSVALERLPVAARHELAPVHEQPRHTRGRSYGMRRFPPRYAGRESNPD